MPRPARRDDLVLVLKRRDSDHQFSHLYAEVCYRNQGRHSGHDFGAVLNPQFIPYPSTMEPYPQYAGLRASCQLNRTDEDRRCYGECIEFTVHRVELAQAESMAKTLRGLTKRMDALRQRWGYPSGFADFLARFADVLSAPRFALYTRDQRPDGSSWRWLDVDHMRQWVATQEKSLTSAEI